MDDGATVKHPHPWVFLALVLPFGASTGYVTVTLAFLLSGKGVAVAAIGALTAASTLPQTWKVLWAPLADTTLTPRLWYLIGAAGVGLSIIAMSLIGRPASAMPLLTALVMVSSVASSFCGMTSDSFLAYFDPEQQGRASGWAQAGNFAGQGVGGGLALYLAQHVQAQWVSGDTVALTGGLIAGVASAVAALFGGYACDYMDRRTAYCLFGLLIAVEVVLVAWMPRTVGVWIGASVLYQALLGACYAAYSAVVLEVIGRGAAATKFNLMASVANVPVTFMPVVDGLLHDRHGTNAMFHGEAALSVAAAVLFGLVVLASRRLLKPSVV